MHEFFLTLQKLQLFRISLRHSKLLLKNNFEILYTSALERIFSWLVKTKKELDYHLKHSIPLYFVCF